MSRPSEIFFSSVIKNVTKLALIFAPTSTAITMATIKAFCIFLCTTFQTFLTRVTESVAFMRTSNFVSFNGTVNKNMLLFPKLRKLAMRWILIELSKNGMFKYL